MTGFHKAPVIDRLMKKVQIVGESGCWIWMGAFTRYGYGTMMVRRKRHHVHRLMAQEMLGDTEGKVVCHKCDIPSCINPDHLFIGSQRDNVEDMYSKGRNGLKHGENHYASKLSKDDALEILNSDERGKDLAERFNIAQSVVSQIRSRQRWRHL